MLSSLLDALAPRLCASCGAVARDSALCSACEQQLVLAPPSPAPSLSVVAPFEYRDPLAVAVRQFKYGDRPDLAEPLAELIAPHVRNELRTCDVLVPIPLHPLRLAERGYNQAALLAHRLARSADAVVKARALARSRHTEQQVGKRRDERLLNVAGAFSPSSRTSLDGLRVTLVDDVVTTGATAEACAEVLRTCGADVRTVIAIARASVASAT